MTRMRNLAIRDVVTVPLGLAESPVWDDDAGALWLVEITERRVLRVAPESGAITRFDMPAEIGSLGLTADGRLVVALRTGVHLFDPASGRLDFLVAPETDVTASRLNDGRVGPDGNFWVGSMDARRPVRDRSGALYRVTPQGACTRVADGFYVSNGLAWSPDGRRMYHADSRGIYVQVFDFDPRDGAATNPRRLLTLTEQDGLPDGAAVDAEGFYWSAGITADVLNRIAPDGSIVERIPLPISAPTMPCFGGADLRTLFVTSLASDRSGSFQHGRLIALDVGVAGLPTQRFGQAPG
ncbi:SMP-30/gluconolactonase/LRE family protein [Roseomonas sp. HJA6]|uniref:SMP-30/gluconolactonase/LRE family protein n=1 Tax=Roseomonas alba TaxID=2846776 RepID=A0ABS7AGF6_9PROT|nr:SMP-30/gluconolactonase/LRE family protein [Neoroseomonas alba]